MNEIENKIEEIKKGCGTNNCRGSYYCELCKKEHYNLCFYCRARLDELEFANDVLKKEKKLYDTLYQLKEDYKKQAQNYSDELDKAEEDLKKKVIQINKAIDECANKTDIWDNERWNKFRKLLGGEIKIIFSNEEDKQEVEKYE